jgi:transcriptional regulator with XRE-family HTH domain
MSIGKRIKELRKKQGLNQAELGEIIGLSYSAVSSIESDRSEATSKVIMKLSELFKVSTDYLLFGTEETIISESEQEILDVLREDKAMTNAMMEFAKVKKKAISYLGSYKPIEPHAA